MSLQGHRISECYFTIGQHVLSQTIGIPMGIDPAPFWANLYLYKYEMKHITSLIKEDKKKALNYNGSLKTKCMISLKVVMSWLCGTFVYYVLKSKVEIDLALFFILILSSLLVIGKEFCTNQNLTKLYTFAVLKYLCSCFVFSWNL